MTTPATNPMLGRFTGKTVVITGASGNIGSAIAARFISEGANVVAAARNRDRLDALVNQLGPKNTLAVVTDVTQSDDLHAMAAAAAARFGSIDLLISNAGSSALVPFEETSRDMWDHMMSTNLESAFFGAQAALPCLKQTRGAIVHISSVSGMGGHKRSAAFNAAKAGMINLTYSLAFELGPEGIRVNSVAPGITAPLHVAREVPFSSWIERANERQALAGHATPEDVAGAVTFLASSDARFITGAVIPVDGGATTANGLPDVTL